MLFEFEPGADAVTIDMTEYGERAVCDTCVSDPYLAREIERSGTISECHYCRDDEAPTCPLSDVADAVELAFEQHFRRTADQPDGMQSMMLADKESSYEWDRDGEQTVYAIMNALNSSESLAEDLQAYLEEKHSDWDAAMIGEECAFDADAHYEEIMPSDGDWHRDWYRFERDLKQETRFFSIAAQTYLTSIFGGIDQMKTAAGKPVIVTAGPDEAISGFYRARVFYNDEKLEAAMKRPDLGLGPPPSQFASAGRMNAHGVSVFYGADTIEGAVAEVRPPVASQVLAGRFTLLRPVRLLDFQALTSVAEPGSVFDPAYAERLARLRFLRSLKHRISRPVMPTDEAFDYLATQAVIDFLANGLGLDLDGVLFPSAQTNEISVNVVLFHRASQVQEIALPEGTMLDASTYMETNEGADPWYTVYEHVPTKAKLDAKKLKAPELPTFMGIDHDSRRHGDRPATLAVDLDSLEVRIVSMIAYETDRHSVSRHRMEKHDDDLF